MKNAIGSELLARWRFFCFLGILILPMQCAFGSKGFASAEAKPLPLMAQSTPLQSHSR